MRKVFAKLLEEEMKSNKDIFLISGDLGYNLWDEIKSNHAENFINPGSSEQLMIGMASGMTLEKKIAVCYSITPFLLYRPFEFIRNYVHHEKLPVKLIGGGRDRDYSRLGFTHWAPEDREVMRVLNNIQCFWPENENDLRNVFDDFLFSENPCYLNLRR
jgi:transketolase